MLHGTHLPADTKSKWVWTSKVKEYTKTIPYAAVQTTSMVSTATKQVPQTYTTDKPYPETKSKTKWEKYTTTKTKSVGEKCDTSSKCETKTKSKY